MSPKLESLKYFDKEMSDDDSSSVKLTWMILTFSANRSTSHGVVTIAQEQNSHHRKERNDGKDLQGCRMAAQMTLTNNVYSAGKTG
jgi:hypothetical protein